MSTTITATQELELVNIISISQIKLANNFSILNRRLNNHDEIFNEHFSKMQSNNSTVLTRINQVQTNTNEQLSLIKSQINEIFNELKSLKQSKVKHEENIKKNQESFLKLNDELFNTQLQFEEKLSIQTNQFNELAQTIAQLQKQLEKVNDEVERKQSKIQAEKVIKQIQQLREKNSHFQAEIKLNQHKIQKIQILNQKNERIQAKKDMEFLRDIEDKVKKQVKVSLKAANITVPTVIHGINGTNGTNGINGVNGTNGINGTNGVNGINGTNGINGSSGQNGQNYENEPRSSTISQKISLSLSSQDKENYLGSLQNDKRPSLKKRLNFSLQQDDLIQQLMKSNIDNPLSKINERLNKIQTQQKDINQIIKSSKFKRDEKSSDGTANIKDKVNQLKPEVIKLWAKFDTLEDRLAFNEKKMDQKNKMINDIMSHQKENNWQKMEQKVKSLQTQLYTNIKDLKAKLDTKVNVTDYQKFVLANDDKIKQINELIYLKSDKLQVKKALLFLESKIKQIILVISEDEENEKDALLTKKPIKCISCDKEVDKFSGNISAHKGNWDNMPFKDHAPETLGRFGMTSFGSLSKKLKRLQGKDLPLLNKKNNYNNNNGNPSSP